MLIIPFPDSFILFVDESTDFHFCLSHCPSAYLFFSKHVIFHKMFLTQEDIDIIKDMEVLGELCVYPLPDIYNSF